MQEECANRLYRVYIHSSNADDVRIVNVLQFIKLSPVNVIWLKFEFRSLMA